jgi:transcription elongation factor Elf1
MANESRQDFGFPNEVDCPNCRREIVVEGNLGEPSAGVDRKRIHHEWTTKTSLAFMFRCPNCGHYTRFEPDAPQGGKGVA